jgi:hypothetical protein
MTVKIRRVAGVAGGTSRTPGGTSRAVSRGDQGAASIHGGAAEQDAEVRGAGGDPGSCLAARSY